MLTFRVHMEKVIVFEGIHGRTPATDLKLSEDIDCTDVEPWDSFSEESVGHKMASLKHSPTQSLSTLSSSKEIASANRQSTAGSSLPQIFAMRCRSGNNLSHSASQQTAPFQQVRMDRPVSHEGDSSASIESSSISQSFGPKQLTHESCLSWDSLP